MSELPKGWAESPLESITQFTIGGDWGNELSDTLLDDYVKVKIIRGTEYKNWNSEKGRFAVIRQIKKNSFEKRKLQVGDIVLEVSGGGPTQPVGRSLILDAETNKNSNIPFVSANFCRLLRLSDSVNPFYVNYNLINQYSKGLFNNYQTQTTNLRNLNYNDFIQNVNIKIAPLNEQKRIVEKLDKLLAKVEDAKARLEKIPVIIKRFRQSVLNAAVTGELTKDWRERNAVDESGAILINRIFINRTKKNIKLKFVEIDSSKITEIKNWSRTCLQNIFDVETGSTPSRKNNAYWENGKIPWIKSGQVQNCDIIESEEYITEKALKETNVSLLPIDTILIAMYGEGKTRGQVGVLKIKATINQACAALVNESIDEVIRNYVYLFCLSQYAEIRMISVGGNQPNLNISKIKNWEINIPPYAEQKEIVKRVEALLKKADEIEERYKKAKAFVDKLTQSILAKAFRGELVPQDPNDPPASKLLEKIKLEKEKLNLNKKQKKKSAGR